MTKNSVAIIDYGINNIHSLIKAFSRIEKKAEIVENYKKLKNFNHIILPGVGSFDMGIKNLHEKGFKDEIQILAKKGTNILGICLGMQLLFQESEESENKISGLSLVEGKCKKFTSHRDLSIRIPHMGWNPLKITKKSKLLKNIENNSDFYFVHSYYAVPNNIDSIIGFCKHGIEFTAAFELDNIMGVQFHPEKCFKNGLKILKQFSALS